MLAFCPWDPPRTPCYRNVLAARNRVNQTDQTGILRVGACSATMSRRVRDVTRRERYRMVRRSCWRPLD